jgi:hypothetical protein
MLPESANHVKEFNPNTGVVTERNPGNLLSDNVGTWQGGTGTVGKNGNIYITPSKLSALFNVMYEYSPNTNSARFIDTGTIFLDYPSPRNYVNQGDPYGSASMDATGNVWFMPFVQGNASGGGFLKVDCSVEPVSLLANISFGRTWGGTFGDQKKYGGMCFHPNGNIYLGGFDYSNAGKYITELNPNDNSVTEYGTIDGTFAQNGSTNGCFPGADGNIYTIPFNMRGVAKLDVSTGTIYQSDYGLDWWSQYSPGSPSLYTGAVSTPNGNTYLLPSLGSSNSSAIVNVLKIDTGSNTITLSANISESVGVRGGICADRSNIYLTPKGNNEVFTMSHNGTGGTNPTNFVISPFNNTNGGRN